MRGSWKGSRFGSLSLAIGQYFSPLAQFSEPLIKACYRPRLRHLIPVLLLTTLCVPQAKAQSPDEVGTTDACSAEQAIHFRGGTLRVENDMFSDTDQNYTSGVAIAAVSHDIAGQLQTKCLPLPVRLHAQLIKFMNPRFWADADDLAQSQNVVVKVGQYMYTPGDYSRSDAPPHPRYATVAPSLRFQQNTGRAPERICSVRSKGSSSPTIFHSTAICWGTATASPAAPGSPRPGAGSVSTGSWGVMVTGWH